MKSQYRIIVAGSRTFADYQLLYHTLDDICNNILTNHPEYDIIIISGDASGADKLGEQYAVSHSYMCEFYPALWGEYGKSAGILRNIEMAK